MDLQFTELDVRSIEGTWEIFPIDETTWPGGWITGCKDLYSYNPDGTFSGESNENVSSGTYSFTESVPEGARHTLIWEYLTDNAQANCQGVGVDATGESQTVYIDFVTDSEGIWYGSPVGDVQPAHFIKIN